MKKTFDSRTNVICKELDNIAYQQTDKKQALQDITDLVQKMVKSGKCTIALVDLLDNELVNVAFSGCSEEFIEYMQSRRIKLVEKHFKDQLDKELILAGKRIEKYYLKQDGQGVARIEIAKKFGIDSILAYPIIIENKLYGYINLFFDEGELVSGEMKSDLEIISNHISVTIERVNSFSNRRRLQVLNEKMKELAKADSVDDLLNQIFNFGLELVKAPHATISQLDVSNGELTVVCAKGGDDLQVKTLREGEGLTNFALKNMKPINAYDIKSDEWATKYVSFWTDTRSELVVPIGLTNSIVRVGINTDRALKPIGVLNLESPYLSFFTDEDVSILSSLVNYGAVLFERLETDSKQIRLAEVQQTILEKTDWDGTIDEMIKGISKTLGYDYVNISLVKSDIGRIKSEYVIGIPDEDIEEFKKLADHPLNGNDIQASIVRNCQIEVPSLDDPRFDQSIYRRFNHSQKIRVFVPLVARSDNRIIGTVEAGYQCTEHRKYIYEQDLQILKGFIDYVAIALDRRQNFVLEKIGHEFRHSVVGIRNNASFLQRRFQHLDQQRIEFIFEDILTDAEILLSQIAQLEHILGKPLPPPNIEETVVFRDVIIKTIRQLAPLIRGLGFESRYIEYDESEKYKIDPIWVDKARLSQVFFNLFTNSVKYVENDPSSFRIKVKIEDSKEDWFVRIQDWGIGVKPEYAEEIFKGGFRTPEAQNCNVTGSGLGITIAKQYMQIIGGDVKLTGFYKPTEFTVIIPKRLKIKPNDIQINTNF